MRHKGLFIGALVVAGVGLLGGLATAVIVGQTQYASTRTDSGARSQQRGAQSPGFPSDGERIYYTGVGHDGPIRAEWDPFGGYGSGMMQGRGGRGYIRMGCVRCHRQDGRGGPIGMMGGGADAPDIRYSTLTQGGSEAGEDASDTVEVGWTDEDIARAIRDGEEPDGQTLDPIMPRWQMDDTDMRATIDYLKELSGR